MAGFRRNFLLVVAVLSAGGCRLFDAGVFGDHDGRDDRVRNVLRSQLGKDNWRRDPSWSLVRKTESEASLHELTMSRRWNYGGRLATELIERLGPATADAYLQEIAGDDGLAGWNALILLAQRSPKRALGLESRLHELVNGPLHYDAETGRRVQFPPRPAPNADRTNNKTGAKSRDRMSPAVLSKLSIAQLVDLADPNETTATSGSPRTVWDEFVDQLTSPRPPAKKQQPRSTRVVSAAMRNAAAEAWCRVLAVADRDPIDGLAPAGRLLQRPDLPPDVRRELVLGTAWHVPPALIPGMAEALTLNVNESGKDEESTRPLRRTAMEACVVHAVRRRTSERDLFSRDSKSSERSAQDRRPAPLRKASESRRNGTLWPRDIHTRRDDPDPDVRILYGRWAALAGIDDALSILDVQCRLSIDKPVRRAAVVSIGLLGTDESRRLLREIAKTGAVPLRIAAIKALSQWGARELAPFLEDESSGVRQAVAEALKVSRVEGRESNGKTSGSRMQVRDSATLAERLLTDKDPAVQTACLHAIANWPDRLAVPLLLQAMRAPSTNVAAKAWQDLQERRPELTGFSLRGNERERSEATDRLVSRFNLSTVRPWPSLAEISALPAAEQQHLRTAVQRDAAVLARSSPREYRYRDAVDRLAGLGREATPYVEKAIERSLGSHPRHVYRTLLDEVLPKLDPAYAALRELEQSDPRARWNAMQKLANLGQQSSLSPLVVKTFHERIADWRNRAVWQAAMQAVMKDSHPEADALAIAASQIPSPSVQTLACEYFRRHPRTQFAGRILELMNSRDKTVRLAAIDAAGYCHQQRLIDGTPAETWQKLPASVPKNQQPKLAASATAARIGLRHWTTAADREVADAAVMSLARLGDELGYRQLHLMSHADDPKRRRRAYEMMGKTDRAQFLSRLIERGLQENSGELKKVILQSLKELTTPDERPVGLSRISGYHERIGAWQEWLNRRRDAGKSRRSERRVTLSGE